ncbi:coiled-coil domain-containing protein, partial [Brachionus plicatilis]
SIELENKLKSLDSEYCANEALRDNLKSDRVKYLTFLERIGNVLKISQISADIGLDMNIDLILARVEQLVKMENDCIQDKQTNIYNLQRKCKTLKEQLDNKELHLDLLRKKLSALEEERANKCALEREVEDHVMMSKKFKLKVEKLTDQLNNLKRENEDLKAQLLDMNCFRGKSSDQDKEIARLISKISELESIKEKQSLKIAKLRDQLDSTNSEISKNRTSSDSTVQSLSQELRSLKQELEKRDDRERQLLDFRAVVARMLGLDASSLAVADYEIISRIERIISSFNEGIVPVHIQPLPANLNSYQPNYNQGYSSEFYSSSSSNEQASPTRRHHHAHAHSSHHSYERSESPSKHHHHHSSQTRHRSKSPRKVTIDPNSY